MNKTDIGRKILLGMVCVFCACLVGLLELVALGFDPSELENPSWWAKLFFNILANFVILYSVAYDKIINSYKKNPEIVGKKQLIEKEVRETIRADFDDYIKEDNKQRKIDAWKEYITKKIAKLEKRRTRRNHEIVDYGKTKDIKNNKYYKKRKYLEYLMSDEYIQKNLLYIHIPYFMITRPLIEMGVPSRKNGKPIETNASLRIVKDNIGKFLATIAFMIAFAVMIPDFKKFTVLTLLLVLMKLFTLAWNFWCGSAYGDHYQSDIILPDLQYRYDYIEKYAEWRLDKKEK